MVRPCLLHGALRLAGVAALLALPLPAVPSDPATGPAAAPLRVGGTGSAVAALERVGEALASGPGGTRLHVLPSLGSTGAARAVADGALDVGVLGRPLRPHERSLGLDERLVARTPFVFAVGPGTPVTGITTDELVGAYRSTLATWPGGKRVRPILRPASDVDSDLVRAISPEVASAWDEARTRPGAVVAVTNTECDEALAHVPGAIGPTSLLQVRSEGNRVVPLRWNGVEPSVANLADGRYPLAKPIWVVFRRSPGEGVRKLLAFLASPGGWALLERLGADPRPFPPVE